MDYFSVNIYKEWEKITSLLNEIEMTYFVDIGFSDENNISLNKVDTTLQTFLNYFYNAQLSYDEQTLERLEINCGKFDNEVKEHFGFSVSETIKFSNYIKDLINKKHTIFELIKIKNQGEWLKDQELGSIFVHSVDDLYKIDLPTDVTTKLIDFLSYDENIKKGKIVYYADKYTFFETPLIKLNKTEYLCPHYKFLIESFYNRINSKLSEIKNDKYTKFKNQNLEKKVSKIFMNLFGKNAKYFKSYYVDKNHSEQDLLIVFKRFYFIVEIKDTFLREPMRNPKKSYDRIKSDFKRSIQKGYEQCVRVENKFEANKPFKIFEDNQSHKSLFEISPNKREDFFSIIVTQFRYGNIQTNLKDLLIKEDEAVYPWSVCIDDLETFILGLKKLKKGGAKTEFIKYLKHREAFNEHLSCADELELCGLFINSPKNFQKYSIMEEFFVTEPNMAQLFDAEYKNGLGFENELDMDIKRERTVPKYRKKWEFDIISHKDLINEKE